VAVGVGVGVGEGVGVGVGVGVEGGKGTAIGLLVPVIEAVARSVAVIVWLPPVLRVALKVPVPLVSMLLAGKIAVPSVLVNWTVPVYPVAAALD
jgi:hypothetical protein